MNVPLFSISPLPESLVWLALNNKGIGFAIVMLGIMLVALAFVMLLKSRGSDTYHPSTVVLFRSKSKARMGAYSVQGDRQYQQDAYFFSSDAEQEGIGQLAIVCDGMGGFEHGEIASRHCVDTIRNGFYQLGGTDDMCQLLKALAEIADKEVSELKNENGAPLKSGTTLVAVVVKNNEAYWVSVGDSRIYMMNDSGISRVTRDHNLRLILQKQADEGFISQNEVDTDPQREALISFIGKNRDTLIDVGSLKFTASKGDRLLLCSDGIYKYLSDGEILEIANQNGANMEAAAKALVCAAMDKPAKHDNITALMIG